MNRTVGVGETDPLKTRVYFQVTLTDGFSPALNENGRQPQISVNGAAPTINGIGALTSTGNGSYYAQLGPTALLNEGDIIQTYYQNPGITQLAYGDIFQVLVNTTVPSTLKSFTYYGTVPDGDKFFSTRLRTKAWVEAEGSDKLKALREATSIIDKLNFAGQKTDQNQLLQFPRANVFPTDPSNNIIDFDAFGNLINPGNVLPDSYDTEIPQDIITAAYLIAIKLLDGYDPDSMARQQRVQENRYGGVAGARYDTTLIPEWELAGIPSKSAWDYLKPYLADPLTIKLSRV